MEMEEKSFDVAREKSLDPVNDQDLLKIMQEIGAYPK